MSQCHHVEIHIHDGDHSICFEDFRCPDANDEMCYCIPVSDEEAGLKKLIDPKNKLSCEEDMKSTIRIGNSILNLSGIVFIGEAYPNGAGTKPYGILIVHELFKVIIWFSDVNVRNNQLENSKNLFEKFKCTT
jgi:hypothetical protein